MPFKSEKQRRFLWKNHPEIAKRWSDKYGSKPVKNQANKLAIVQRLSARSNTIQSPTEDSLPKKRTDRLVRKGWRYENGKWVAPSKTRKENNHHHPKTKFYR